MCDGCERTEAVSADAGTAQLKSSSFRDRLESRRNSLTRQLTQVEQALQLLYTNPDAEKTYDILKRTGVL